MNQLYKHLDNQFQSLQFILIHDNSPVNVFEICDLLNDKEEKISNVFQVEIWKSPKWHWDSFG
jgi:hypothetical protein